MRTQTFVLFMALCAVAFGTLVLWIAGSLI